MRNLFLTKTVLGLLGTLISLYIAISPNVESIILRRISDKTSKQDFSDVSNIVVGILGTIGASISIYGRYSVGDVYTPKGVPGRDYQAYNDKFNNNDDDFGNY